MEPKAITFETFQADFNTKEMNFGTGLNNREVKMNFHGRNLFFMVSSIGGFCLFLNYRNLGILREFGD